MAGNENPNAFKHWFNRAVVERIASRLNELDETFDAEAFVGMCLDGLDALELKDRVRHITTALRTHLPEDYPTAVSRILAALPAPLASTEEVANGFDIWPFCHFVETYGLEHFDVSMNAMYELTQRFSAEFAIRPFIVRHPTEVFGRLQHWTADPNPHVRRWVSEGSRPRLPWGMRLNGLVEDPSPLLPLLGALRHDPEEYVRRSVANNLNDIAKDHADLVVSVVQQWWPDSNTDERRMLKHALRTLVKQGHPGALAILGFGPPSVEVLAFNVSPAGAKIGGEVTLELELRSTSDENQSLLLDYAVHHQRANGKTSPKVFKWTTRTLAAREELTVNKRHSLKVVTTRKYYPGVHRVELLVNGASLDDATFELE